MIAFKLLVIPISTVFLYGCEAAVNVTDEVKTSQAFDVYISGNYTLFECNDVIVGTMNVSSSQFRFTETVCDLKPNGFSENPLGPKALLTNCRSDGGDETDVIVIFEPTESGLNLHGYDGTVREFKKCT